MTLEELCALRDKFIMDPNYSQEQKDYMYGQLTEQILAIRN